MSFSLRDVLKAIMIFKKSKADITSSLWLAVLCKYNTDDQIKIAEILQMQTSDVINIKRTGDGPGKKLQFISSTVVEIEAPGFEHSLLSLTKSEKMLMYQLALAHPSGRPILVYGQSPSGKSYTIKNLAKIMGKEIISVPVNSESTSSLLIGRLELNEDGQVGFRKGPLLDAIENGKWIVIEDIHLARGDLLERLNSLCEENPTLNDIEKNKPILYSKKNKSHKLNLKAKNPKK